jgi:hypothetical protein
MGNENLIPAARSEAEQGIAGVGFVTESEQEKKTEGLPRPVLLSATAGFQTFPRRSKKGSRKRMDSGEGCPFPLETFTALRILSCPVVVEQSLFQARLVGGIR